MRRRIVSVLLVLLLLLLVLNSCKVEVLKGEENINNMLYPYLEFTLSEDGSYYTAEIIENVRLESVEIPSSLDNLGTSIPVLYFAGFKRAEDSTSLKELVLASSKTQLDLTSISNYYNLEKLTIKTIDKDNTIWKNLPELEKDGEIFLGWFLPSGARIYNGSVIVKGHTTLHPMWEKHKHTLVFHEEVKATCTTDGNISYYECSSCGRYFLDKDGKEGVSDIVLKKLGHQFPLEKVEKKEPTCTENGNTEYYRCARCNSIFSDKDGLEQKKLEDVLIPSKGHKPKEGFKHDETSHWQICENCNEVINKEKHTFGPWHDTEDYRERECTKCGYKETASKEHKWKKFDRVESTCKERGHKEYWKCENHEGEYSLDENGSHIYSWSEIEPLIKLDLKEHTLGDYKSDDNYHWKECSVCGEVINKEEHTYEYLFTSNVEERKLTVTRKCSVCGREDSNTSSSKTGAFDISAVFGSISVKRESDNSWTLSYLDSNSNCYWSGEDGVKLIEGPEEFTIACTIEGTGDFKVFCHILDKRGKEKDLAFVLLSN